MIKLKEITDAVEKLATSAEKIHLEIAHKPIEVAERISPNLPLAKTVGEVQAKLIGGVYDVIRGVNRSIAGLAAAAEKPAAEAPAAKPPAQAEAAPAAR